MIWTWQLMLKILLYRYDRHCAKK